MVGATIIAIIPERERANPGDVLRVGVIVANTSDKFAGLSAGQALQPGRRTVRVTILAGAVKYECRPTQRDLGIGDNGTFEATVQLPDASAYVSNIARLWVQAEALNAAGQWEEANTGGLDFDASGIIENGAGRVEGYKDLVPMYLDPFSGDIRANQGYTQPAVVIPADVQAALSAQQAQAEVDWKASGGGTMAGNTYAGAGQEYVPPSKANSSGGGGSGSPLKVSNAMYSAADQPGKGFPWGIAVLIGIGLLAISGGKAPWKRSSRSL